MAKKLANKDINLLSVYKVKSEPSKNTAFLKAMVLPLSVSVIFLTIFGVQTYRTSKMQASTEEINQEIAKLQEQIANDPNREKYEKYVTDMQTLQQLKTLYEDLQSYPQLSQDTFDQILLASDLNVDVISFSYVRDSQVITLQIQGRYANDTENFVRRLKTSNIFSKVDYSGYSRVEQEIPIEKPQQNTNTEEKDEKQELLEALLNMNTDKNNQQETQTKTVYNATVLCTLK